MAATSHDTKIPDSKTIEAEQQAEATSTSKGEKAFDWLTYGGIGFLGVFLAGIPIAYWGKYGGGAKYFKDSSKALEKMGLSTHTAEDIVMTTVLMMPGNLGLIPIKMMENNKPKLVEKFNNMLGDKSADASVEMDDQQTWGSLIKGRLAGWLAVFCGFRGAATLIGQEKFAAFENKFAEYVVCKPLGKPTHIPGLAKIAENETKFFRAGKIAALDVFATAAATTLLYLGSRMFAEKNPEWHAKHSAENDRKKAEEAAGATATSYLPSPGLAITQKLFTNSISPRTQDITPKARTGNFADAVAARKASVSDASMALST